MKPSVCEAAAALCIGFAALAACSNGAGAPSASKPNSGTSAKDAGPDSAPPKHDAGGADAGTNHEAGLGDGGDEAGFPADAGGDAENDAEADHDGGEGGVVDDCTTPPHQGDLVIGEIMAESRTGTGDDGEWLEIRNASTCRLNLNGLDVSSPRGSTADHARITQDQWLLPGASLVVADTLDHAANHDLPGTVIAWDGTPSDVLRNGGDTVTLTLGGVETDAVTYAAADVTPGASLEFPASCSPEDRGTMTKWQKATHVWADALAGTPNAPNDDVACK